MSAETLAIYMTLILVPLVIAYIILVQWPALTDSKYHAKLWNIRDQVMDDVLAGRLAWSPGARNLIAHLESLAHNSREANLLKALLLVKMDVIREQELTNFEDIMLGDGTPLTDRTRLLGYLTQAQQVTIEHLPLASIEGVVGAAMLFSKIVRRKVARSFRSTTRPRMRNARRGYLVVATPVARAEMLQVVKQNDPDLNPA